MNKAVSSVAHYMGLDDLRPGRHIQRNEKRWRIGELQVAQAWHALILPSFHDRAALGVVRAVDTEFRGETFHGFLRAGIAVQSLETSALVQTVVADIDDDPLPCVVNALDLMATTESMWLDGIAYELNTTTGSCQVNVAFSTPTVPQFLHVENALFTVAERIAEVSGEATVREYVEMWRGYISDSGRAS